MGLKLRCKTGMQKEYFAWVAVLFGLASLCNGNSEADALLAIKSELGASNSNLSTWKGQDPCLNWEGVSCVGNTVTKLNLTGKGLSGQVPKALGDLLNLEFLDLSNNNISGPIPGSFANLSILQALNLSSNPLTGSFPDPILKIKSLIDLRMGSCNLTGVLPTAIGNVEKLQFLHLPDNKFSEDIPSGIGSLLQLVELSLWGNLFSTKLPTFLTNLTNLKLLNLCDCFIEGELPSEWGTSLPNMEHLELCKNNITGYLPESWQKMKNLTYLRLNDNMLTGDFPSWVLNLTYANLRCNFFTGEDPPSANYSAVWKGNCFSDLRDHNRQCKSHNQGCSKFLSEAPPAPPPPHPPPPPPPPDSKKQGISIHTGAIVGIVSGISIVLVSGGIITWCCCHQKPQGEDVEGSGTLLRWENATEITRFSLEEISKATGNFSAANVIGSGGFGKVYSGCLEDGTLVAIKKASFNSKQGSTEFRNEIALLGRLHHRHLVRLQGFCHADGQKILVYEFMKNGNLHDCLIRRKHGAYLNWHQRLEIAVGVARGLDYLHSFADPPVIHRDMKPSNVLLDENMVAKISDFGISKVTPEFDTHVSTRPAGTAGYLDPEYFLRRQLTTASDVYGFGVILLELVTGQEAIDDKRLEDVNLVEWVRSKFSSGGIQSIIDPSVQHDYPADIYEVLATLALRCTTFSRTERPPMKQVLSTLESLLGGLSKPETVGGTFIDASYTTDSDMPNTTFTTTSSSTTVSTTAKVPPH